MKLPNKIFKNSLWLVIPLIVFACVPAKDESAGNNLRIDFEKYVLPNGLNIVLHEDHSDPIVSTAILYHVGSNRETKGRTGFAHLFEHMLFQESENVDQDQFFKKIQDAGGTLNGGTWQDGTIYYEVVPKNAMEMVLWLESDRMGYFINTVTEGAFVNQQEVVQNEKRQRVDNNPYGHTNYVIHKAMFPDGHPYNWQVIGELEDLQNATVEDVKEFYRNFYGPNNATLVLAGDFNKDEAKALIEKYFGEIEASGNTGESLALKSLEPMNVAIDETIRLYHQDNFAKVPQLNMVWAAVHSNHPDSYPLNFLAQLLSQGKKAPLYKVLEKEKELTSDPQAFNDAMELAGKFQIRINANDGVDLDDIEEGIFEAFKRFETEGITDKDVERVKASLETNFYNGISSILGKSFQLASYNAFNGDPGYIEQDIENILAVTKDDIIRVYNLYIKDKPFILTSFVPKGQMDLMAENSNPAQVKEEAIVENVDAQVAESDVEVEKTPSEIDRSAEPPKGEQPGLQIPTSWTVTLDNGMEVYGIRQDELPLVNFNLVIKGGHMLDDFGKIGVANLMTDIMQEGTKNKTPEELEEEIELLGANINMFTSDGAITISGNTLARNFEKTLDLVEEMLLEPRWDEEEFGRIKTSTVNQVIRREANPSAIAGDVFDRILYGDENMRGYNTLGTPENINSITIDDLKGFYDNYFSPSVTNFHVVGSVTQERVMDALKDLELKWAARDVTIPEYAVAEQTDNAKLLFYDVPDAKQSVINIGYLALKRTDPDYYPVQVMNHGLGGSFNSRVNLVLREEKGYTYGARTFFDGTDIVGAFNASSSVRTNVTLESVKIFREEMDKYREGISEDDLEFTKNALIKSNARRFETQGSLLGMLQTMSAYNFGSDYIKKEEDIVRNMTLEQHKGLAQKYLIPSKMIYLIVGDARSQFPRFADQGFDVVALVDKEGKIKGDKISIEVNQQD
jgi:zinc protease